METQRTKLLVLSGGLDSVTLLNSLINQGEKLRAIYLDIGYLPSPVEKCLVKSHCYKHHIPLDIIDAKGVYTMASGFIPLEFLGMGELDKGEPDPIPSKFEYVSAFHLTLSYATFFAMLAGITDIYTGIIKEQIETTKGLNDFLDNFCSLVLKINPKKELTLHVPFRNKYKSEVIQLGLELGVDFKETWSCYKAGPIHCGKCNGCQSRKKSFVKVKIKDQTKYLD